MSTKFSLTLKKSLFLLVSLVMLAALFLTGCTKSTTGPAVSGGGGTNNSVFSMAAGAGAWPKPPLYQGNPYGSGGVGPAWTFAFEGLFQITRDTNMVYKRMAQSISFKGNQTIVKLKHNVKWQDGKPFTSKDVWAFYTLNNGAEITKYLTGIETPDKYTVIFDWQTPSPNNTLKEQFIAQDYQGTIAYHLYKKYVDKAAALLKTAKKTNDPTKKGPFGLYISPKLNEKLGKNWTAFTKAGPALPMGTGPYVVKKVTASNMLLEKNPLYYNAKNVKFGKLAITMTGSDPSAGYALLQSGKVDWFDGTPPKDILDSMIKNNKNLVHYRMYDPATIGMMFNLAHKPFDNKTFRKAIVYALNRQKIREVGNFYGTAPNVSIAGLPQAQLSKEVIPSIRQKMTKFTYDPAKAASLLKSIGWHKGSDGNWRDPSGKVPHFIIGVNTTWLPGVNSGQVAAEQLTKFGLPTKLMAVDGTVYYNNATKGNGKYDMSIDWVDVQWGFSSAWKSLNNMYWGGNRDEAHMPLYKSGPDKGSVDLVLPGPDGKKININDALKQMPFMNAQQEKLMASKLIWITNENAMGVAFFQNVTGAFGNMADVKGWPMANQIQKYHRNLPLPTNAKDTQAVVNLNQGFAGAQPFVDGTYKPAK